MRGDDGVTARDALERLYEAAGGSRWRTRDNWLSMRNVCKWHGIGCYGGVVTSVDLGGNGVQGTLPTELGRLSALRVLNIDDSRLSGSMPATFWTRMTGLQTILLAGNPQLSGTMPQLGSLVSLTELDTSRTALSGTLGADIGSLRVLQRLQTDHTAISGVLPTELGQLTRTASLFVHESARFSGTLPTELGHLGALVHGASFSGTRISGTIPSELGHITRLRELWIVRAALSGSVPSSIGLMASLNHLEVHGNRLSGVLPSELGRLALGRCCLTAAQGPHQPRHGMRPLDELSEDTNHFACPLPTLPAPCIAHLKCADRKSRERRGRSGRLWARGGGGRGRRGNVEQELFRPMEKASIGIDADDLAP